MMICKIQSIQKLHEGLVMRINNEEAHFYDPSSMAIILRSIYEMTSIFYYTYVKPNTDMEKNILYLLWVIKGLRNRQDLPNIPLAFKDTQEKEQKLIVNYIKRIKDLGKRLGMEHSAYKRLCDIAQNKSNNTCGYQFIRNYKNIIVKFEPVKFGSNEQSEEILGNSKYVVLYKVLSSYAHPSFFGVMQFGQMYNSTAAKDLENIVLSVSSILCCRFIGYFYRTIVGGIEAFKKLTPEQQKILNFGNVNFTN